MNRGLGLTLTLTVALIAPASSPAAVTIGSALTGPGTIADAPCPGICTFNQDQPAYSGEVIAAPTDGVITSWGFRSGDSGNIVALRVLRPLDNQGKHAGLATSSNVATNGQTQTGLLTRLPVKAGDQIGVDTTGSVSIFNSADSTPVHRRSWSPALADGESADPRGLNKFFHELFVQATIEPDADGDGYGDETQDACLGNPAAHTSPCPTAGPVTPTPTPTVRTGVPGTLQAGNPLTVEVDVGGTSGIIQPVVTITIRGPRTFTQQVPGTSGQRFVAIAIPADTPAGRYNVTAVIAPSASPNDVAARAPVHSVQITAAPPTIAITPISSHVNPGHRVTIHVTTTHSNRITGGRVRVRLLDSDGHEITSVMNKQERAGTLVYKLRVPLGSRPGPGTIVATLSRGGHRLKSFTAAVFIGDGPQVDVSSCFLNVVSGTWLPVGVEVHGGPANVRYKVALSVRDANHVWISKTLPEFGNSAVNFFLFFDPAIPLGTYEVLAKLEKPNGQVLTTGAFNEVDISTLNNPPRNEC